MAVEVGANDDNIKRQLVEEEKANNTFGILIFILVCFGLSAFLLYDRRNGYRYVNCLRHQIGEIMIRIRTYNKKKSQKQMKI